MMSVGFIGVGSIGAPMAKRLIQSGYQLCVCDQNAEALKNFSNLGAKTTEKPSDCAVCDFVIVMVANDAQVQEVLEGPEGLLNSIDADKTLYLAVMSTVLPSTVQMLAPLCAKKNVRLLDAPVSGFPTRAAEGKLSIMVGGDSKDFEAMQPIFKVMGENIHHMGELGTGEISKLVNNILGITNLFLGVEAMLTAQKSGMDLKKLTSVMDKSSGRNFATQDWEKGRAVFQTFSQSDDLAKVAYDLSLKDLEHAKKLAEEVDVKSPFLDHIIRAFQSFSPEELKEQWHAV
ncbi:MAG: NAD(P)-dependent oxidoreductase [Deltaproteobacteria bacterium]|mgnify:FL=1|nr:NAD(P)-dependent oxidoreductase [Deltaproteobacteria bacterium]MBT4263871.1 NAD(P)-dependent oxidoreductase [Deltaproteobacteria bacterium]MBT4639490.1 NAD(P)-dependent oxidoreductase [Deltaproteobacteria bacterium]MBT6499278.1 NAD(P)-dependent oxidoreductase [Deltaproteobacteria bacterium]MBT6613056.1 NAD(P)-dependent oxidoreductase [Deltaproteobacteria bacterium]